MRITIYDYKTHGNELTFDKVESVAEVGVRASAKEKDTGIVITLDLDYSMSRAISYIQYINRADFSRIEIN